MCRISPPPRWLGHQLGVITTSRGHATARHASTTSGRVHLTDDGVAHSLELLLHRIKLLLLGVLGSFQPFHGLVELVLNGLGLVLGHGSLELVLLDGVLHLVAVGLELVLGVDALLGLGVLLGVLLGLAHHAVNVVLGQTALVVGDGNVGLLARGTL